MALHLLGKTYLKSHEEIIVHDHGVYQDFEKICQILNQHGLSIRLAEPVITTDHENGSFISWYCDTQVEPVVPLADQYEIVRQKLTQAISVLSTFYAEDPEKSQLLHAALTVQSRQDLLIADDLVVIKNWGLKSLNQGTPSTLNLFSMFAEGKQNNQAPETPSLAEKPALIDQKDPIGSRHVYLKNGNFHGRGWVIITRVIAAILFFIIGLLLGWRILYAERPKKIAGISVVEAQELVHKKPEIEKHNHQLEDEIKKLEEQLKHSPCDLQKSRALPELNKHIDTPFTPMKSDGKTFQGSLPELLERSTVFILVLSADENGNKNVTSGSGFFVTPDLIVTNRHVVENTVNNTILVTNKSLGQLKKAHITSISNRSDSVDGFDLAVLKIEDAPPQQPLSFSLEAQPLQTVVAAGYPGIIIRQDNALKRLIQGDRQAIPGVILTKGEINAIQDNAHGEKIMPHSAAVSPGNSGGALVDLCGRVVGVNTFVTVDQETSSHSNYAQKSDSIVQALQGANVPIQVQTGACKENPPTAEQNQKQPQSDPKGQEQSNNLKEKSDTPNNHKPETSSTHHGETP
ncbi:S1C family serine protease [Commensalibacter oyaizuii]|uniref:Trypsin-like peptidase domain-containing protein n=1 Tax=Commensalibacter oyaizuii TaxID=3043873 RepID=A0ABT6PZ87_9PROT|nr:trypsin-like peptidase domain-containing protein [Commensalibacter sp. TBRC 16381]MDI2090170.1 trypsin-like peptidase domain-containing protein [Commensalibacter sp. TBRC 16381]